MFAIACCSQAQVNISWAVVEANGLQNDAPSNAYMIINQGKYQSAIFLMGAARMRCCPAALLT
jgi:hypothetical protein